MAWVIFSDIHGAYSAIGEQLEPSDTAFLLGDYLDLLEFERVEGIVADLVGPERLRAALQNAMSGDADDFRVIVSSTLHPGGEHHGALLKASERAYDRLMDSIPCQAYVLHGNTDFPGMVRARCTENRQFVDGTSIKIDGLCIGFVGGCLPTPHQLAGEEEPATYNAKFDAIGEVDILFMHIPPDLEDITYDVKARRKEVCSRRAVEYIRDVQPRYVYFGHVHSPRSHTTSLGSTLITNVGYFRRHQQGRVHYRGTGRKSGLAVG